MSYLVCDRETGTLSPTDLLARYTSLDSLTDMCDRTGVSITNMDFALERYARGTLDIKQARFEGYPVQGFVRQGSSLKYSLRGLDSSRIINTRTEGTDLDLALVEAGGAIRKSGVTENTLLVQIAVLDAKLGNMEEQVTNCLKLLDDPNFFSFVVGHQVSVSTVTATDHLAMEVLPNIDRGYIQPRHKVPPADHAIRTPLTVVYQGSLSDKISVLVDGRGNLTGAPSCTDAFLRLLESLVSSLIPARLAVIESFRATFLQPLIARDVPFLLNPFSPRSEVVDAMGREKSKDPNVTHIIRPANYVYPYDALRHIGYFVLA